MAEHTPEELAGLARGLVAAAATKNIVVRVMGGVAVYATCPSIKTHPALQRSIKDVDLVAHPSDFSMVEQALAAQEAVLRKRDKGLIVFDKAGVEIELTAPDYMEDHRVDLAPRLELATPALPASDLLLLKLQRVKFVEKDIQDSVALLLDHGVVSGGAGDQIDPEYIGKLCARDWGLFTAVYDNTVTLEKVMDKYLGPDDARLVWERIELIQGEMDSEPKSLPWMLNQFIHRPTRIPA